MKCTFSIMAALLLCSGSVFAQFPNPLEGGTNVNVDTSWTNDTLWVGQTTSSNTLSIVDDGMVFSTNAFVGETGASSNNTASITGTGSWTIEDTLTIGTGIGNSVSVSDGGTLSVGNIILHSGNTLSLNSGGSIAVDGGMNVYSNTSLAGSGTIQFGTNDSALVFNGLDIAVSADLVFDGGLGNNTISVNAGSFAVSPATASQYPNFQTLALNDSTLEGFGTIDAFDSINMIGGAISPQGTDSDTGRLVIDSLFTPAGGTVYNAQVYKTRWDELVFAGPANDVDLSDMEANVVVYDAPLSTVTIMSNSVGNLTGDEFDQVYLEDRLLLYKAVLQYTSNTVQIAVEPDAPESVMEFAAMEMVRAGFNGMQNAVFTRTKQLRRNLVATAHTIAYETPLLTNTNAPAGALGPGDQNTIFDMHVWLQQYSGQGDFDRRNNADGYTLNNNGTTIGADRLIGEALILGVNYTYARSDADTTGNDDLDSETYWIGTYGEWIGEDGLYVDALVSFGFTDYDTERREIDYVGKASYRGQAFGASADVGQYYHLENLALAPYVGLRVLTINAEDHNEKDEFGSSVKVDEVTRDVVESAIGFKMRHRFDTRVGRFQTTGYAEWTHDFMDDDVSATLTADGFPSVDTASLSPDTDTVNVGLGYSWICREYMEIGIGYAGRFSEKYEEHTGALMLDIMF